MQAHDPSSSTRINPVPEFDSVRWLPALTVMVSTAGIVAEAWVVVLLLF